MADYWKKAIYYIWIYLIPYLTSLLQIIYVFTFFSIFLENVYEYMHKIEYSGISNVRTLMHIFNIVAILTISVI